MAEADPLKMVKTNIRSILQSIKNGVPFRSINRDYMTFYGEAVPFKKNGFPNLDALLRAMPDTVRFEMRDGELHCSAIADESTAHIAAMVSKQRSAKKKPKKGGWGGMRRPNFIPRREKFGGNSYPSYKPPYRPPAYRPIPRNTGYAYPQPQPRPEIVPAARRNFIAPDHRPPNSTNLRSINQSPKGSVKVTIASIQNRTTPHHLPNLPPRLRNQTAVDSFQDAREYKNALFGFLGKKGLGSPVYETVKNDRGFNTFVTVQGKRFESGGPFGTKSHSEQAAARVACVNMNVPKIFNATNTQNEHPTISESESNLLKERVEQLLSGKTNGLWANRLPVLYKDKYREDPPPSLTKLLDSWSDIVEILPTHDVNLKILYPAKRNIPVSPTAQAQSKNNLQKNKPVIKEVLDDFVAPAIGSTQQVYISHVAGCSHFYVQVDDCDITEITQLLVDLYGGVKTHELPVTKLEAGKYVAAWYDEYWYRAQILSQNSSSSKEAYDVLYVDFGNTETVEKSKMQRLLPSCYKYPIQAILCQLDNIYARRDKSMMEDASDFLRTFQDKIIKMKVVRKQGSKCVVELYDADCQPTPPVSLQLIQKGLVRSVPVDHVKEPGPLVLPSENEWEVIVTEVISAHQVVMRLYGEDYSDQLSELEEAMACFPPTDTSGIPEPGDMCAALIDGSTEEGDSPWYRVRVSEVKTKEGKALVECVDYGDLEEVPLSQLRPLRPPEASLPFQAITAYLTGLEGCEKNDHIKELLTKMVLNMSLVAQIESRDGAPSITLYDTSEEVDVNINETLVSKFHLSSSAPKLPKEGEMCEVFLSHADIDGGIFLQIQGPGLLELDHLSSQVSETLSKGGAEYFVSELKEGKLVLVPYGDGGWYRATIQDILPDRKVLLYFVDYGNQELVSCSMLRDLEKVSQALHQLPHQAICVTLDNLPPGDSTWTELAIDKLCELAPADRLIQVETVQAASDIVQLYTAQCNGPELELMSINEEIQDSRFWIVSGDAEESSPSTISSLEADAEINRSFSDASVTSQQANEVLLETEGLLRNLSVTTEGVIGEAVLPTPAFMSYVDLNSNLPPKSQSDFKSPPESKKDYKLPPKPQADSSIPSPSQADCSIPAQTPLPDVDYAALSLPPGLELPSSGSQVFITWVADPSNFRCVSSSALQRIKQMKDEMTRFYTNEGNLLVVDNLKIGGLYAGYHEQEGWSRIRIKDVIHRPLISTSKMVSAQFVDVGDFSLITIDLVRHLPTQFRRLPFQAIQARLSGVDAEAGIWGADSIERFESMTLKKTFFASIHDVTSTTVVNMTLSECKSQEEDSLVHKKLINEGLAVSCPIPNGFCQ